MMLKKGLDIIKRSKSNNNAIRKKASSLLDEIEVSTNATYNFKFFFSKKEILIIVIDSRADKLFNLLNASKSQREHY